MVTVSELCKKAGLTPQGPVPWRTPIPREDGGSEPGIYIVARVSTVRAQSPKASLRFTKPLLTGLTIDLNYEKQRWLPSDPVLYIGRTKRALTKRITEFYNHKCGRKSPHAGGQVLKLLKCDLWVYWCPVRDPVASEKDLIAAFKQRTGEEPFANKGAKRTTRRI
jgi:hypothetical protein